MGRWLIVMRRLVVTSRWDAKPTTTKLCRPRRSSFDDTRRADCSGPRCLINAFNIASFLPHDGDIKTDYAINPLCPDHTSQGTFTACLWQTSSEQSWEPVTSIGRKSDGYLAATGQDAYILIIARLSPTHLRVNGYRIDSGPDVQVGNDSEGEKCRWRAQPRAGVNPTRTSLCSRLASDSFLERVSNGRLTNTYGKITRRYPYSPSVMTATTKDDKQAIVMLCPVRESLSSCAQLIQC